MDCGIAQWGVLEKLNKKNDNLIETFDNPMEMFNRTET